MQIRVPSTFDHYTSWEHDFLAFLDKKLFLTVYRELFCEIFNKKGLGFIKLNFQLLCESLL